MSNTKNTCAMCQGHNVELRSEVITDTNIYGQEYTIKEFFLFCTHCAFEFVTPKLSAQNLDAQNIYLSDKEHDELYEMLQQFYSSYKIDSKHRYKANYHTSSVIDKNIYNTALSTSTIRHTDKQTSHKNSYNILSLTSSKGYSNEQPINF